MRQFTTASGRAPTQARFMSDSATTLTVPPRGSTEHQRWLPSVVMARPLPVSTPVVGCRSFSTAASSPGPTTVFRNNWWSYCLYTHAGSTSRSSRSAPTSAGACRSSPDGPDGASGSAIGLSYRGASSCREEAGTSASTSPSNPSRMRSEPPSVTRPMTAAVTSHLSQMASTRSNPPGSTIASIRSWDSLVITSWASMPGSRRGTAETSTSMPTPPRDAVSLVAHVRPAPPRSWMPMTRPSSSICRHASMRRFSSYGSPTWTLGRLSPSSSAENPAEASTLTPPMPSRPVLEPSSTARLPTPEACPSTRRSVGSNPRHSTFTNGFPL